MAEPDIRDMSEETDSIWGKVKTENRRNKLYNITFLFYFIFSTKALSISYPMTLQGIFPCGTEVVGLWKMITRQIMQED